MQNLTPITRRQQEILVWMWRFFLEEDRLPSTREISAHFGFRSQTGAVSHLRALCFRGWLEHRTTLRHDRGWYRFTYEAKLYLIEHDH